MATETWQPGDSQESHPKTCPGAGSALEIPRHDRQVAPSLPLSSPPRTALTSDAWAGAPHTHT